MITARTRRGLTRALSASLVTATVLLGAQDAAAQRNQNNQRVPAQFDVVPISITSVVVQDGQLIANGLVGTNPFTSPVTLTTQPGNAVSPSGAACPILNLELGPIDLNLLGLRVETSPICLEITAYEGGGLLGDLLCSVANLLQSGVPLADVLAQLETAGNLTRFLNGIATLFDQALDQVTSNTVANQSTGGIAATCSVLSLSLGPVQLNLLGLEVVLDDCSNGPVTVDITAIPGGGLLGDLLCSLSDLLGGGGAQTAIQAVLWQIARLIGGLVG
jgi:hypothetical protein